MKSDIITKIQTTYTPDGSGGYTEETIELGSFDVKLGVSNNVQEATAYGVSVEQILKVIADVPLLEDNSEVYIIVGPSGPPGPASPDHPVLSVNEKTGHVVLDAEDVDALPADTPIPVVEYLSNSDILDLWNSYYKGE